MHRLEEKQGILDLNKQDIKIKMENNIIKLITNKILSYEEEKLSYSSVNIKELNIINKNK